MIVNVFPTEVTGTYYIPYVKDKASQTKVCAKGKLQNTHAHVRSMLLQSNVVSSARGHKATSTNTINSVRLGFNDYLTQEGINYLFSHQIIIFYVRLSINLRTHNIEVITF